MDFFLFKYNFIIKTIVLLGGGFALERSLKMNNAPLRFLAILQLVLLFLSFFAENDPTLMNIDYEQLLFFQLVLYLVEIANISIQTWNNRIPKIEQKQSTNLIKGLLIEQNFPSIINVAKTTALLSLLACFVASYRSMTTDLLTDLLKIVIAGLFFYLIQALRTYLQNFSKSAILNKLIHTVSILILISGTLSFVFSIIYPSGLNITILGMIDTFDIQSLDDWIIFPSILAHVLILLCILAINILFFRLANNDFVGSSLMFNIGILLGLASYAIIISEPSSGKISNPLIFISSLLVSLLFVYLFKKAYSYSNSKKNTLSPKANNNKIG